jgi:tetratricopeptide (TPR) repeat protein
MKPSNELFKLVKSLSKSEKRFFKLSSSLQTGDKNYLKIFDYIDKQESYDEEELKNYFKKERFIEHLPSEKNHLYKLILKSLRSFYSEHTVVSILTQELKNIEILYQKALYKECEKFVKKAKRIAVENEKFYYWFELISWEKKLFEEAFESGDFGVDIDEVIAEEEMVISKLRNLAEYQILYSKINYIFRSGGFSRNEEEKKIVDSITDYHLIKGKNTALSTRATTMCYYIKGLCSATNRNYQESLIFFLKVRDILDKAPKIKESLSKRYVLTLSHLLRCYMDSGDYTKATEIIHEIRSLESEKGFASTDIKIRIFSVSYSFELMLNNLTGNFEKSIQMLPELNEQLILCEDKLNKEQKIIFKYHSAYAYFGIGDYKKALFYLNDILNDNEQFLRQDLYNFARLLNLLVHYELENYEFLSYIIKSTNRFVNKTSKDYEIENYLMKQLRKLIKPLSRIERLEIFGEMQSEVNELLKNPQEQVILEYFDLLAWVNSKVDNVSMQEAIQVLKV